MLLVTAMFFIPPKGVTAQLRTDGDQDFVFLMNFNNYEEKVILAQDIYEDMISSYKLEGEISLAAYGFKIMKKKSK